MEASPRFIDLSYIWIFPSVRMSMIGEDDSEQVRGIRGDSNSSLTTESSSLSQISHLNYVSLQ
jgi:hypothetical protein